jgi:hypothetical protein
MTQSGYLYSVLRAFILIDCKGTGYLSKKTPSRLLSLCMTQKLDPMLDVSSMLSSKDALAEIVSNDLVCPHVSFDNPGASRRAPPRESIETRSLVITKEQDI